MPKELVGTPERISEPGVSEPSHWSLSPRTGGLQSRNSHWRPPVSGLVSPWLGNPVP